MKLVLLIIGFLLSQISYAQTNTKFGMNDVSILFPLPSPDQILKLIGMDFQTHGGELLPEVYFSQLPVLAFVPNIEIKDQIRVVGLRIDPCFNEKPLPLSCDKQLRLIWQPINVVQNTTSTTDAALHTFYSLSDLEFKDLLSELALLNAQYPDRNQTQTFLSIHPVLKKEGLDGVFYNTLQNILKKYAGQKKLTRITFMQLSGNENIWIFGGFDIKNQKMSEIQIARIGKTRQEFRNSAGPQPFWFLGGIFPAPGQTENLNVLVKDSRKLGPANENEIVDAVRWAFKFEHPKAHNPGTLDCVSCHVAQATKTWALKQYPWLTLDQVHKNEIYTSENNDIRNSSPMQIHTDIVRSFGYFMNRPFVAQRTINETSEVVNQINAYVQAMEPK